MRHVVLSELKNASPISLEARLKFQDISTIPPAEVEKYKLKKLAEMPSANTLGRIAQWFGKTAREFAHSIEYIEELLLATMMYSAIGAVVSMLLIPLFLPFALLAFFLVPVFAVVSFLGFVLTIPEWKIRTSAIWVQVPFEKHNSKHTVPDMILARVATVQSFYELLVLELRQDTVVFDPILIAFDANTGEECVIGIWEGDRIIA